MKFIKKLFKVIFVLAVLAFSVLLFFAVIRPVYLEFKANKKVVVVDTSGERATTKIKEAREQAKQQAKEAKDKVKEKSEGITFDKKDYSSFVFDDRVLLYDGDQIEPYIGYLADVLVEDIDHETFSKVDVKFVNVSGIGTKEISYSNLDDYRNTLNKFKTSRANNATYNVSYELNTLKTIAKKVIITQK